MKQKFLTLLLAVFMMVASLSMNSEAAETEEILKNTNLKKLAYIKYMKEFIKKILTRYNKEKSKRNNENGD